MAFRDVPGCSTVAFVISITPPRRVAGLVKATLQLLPGDLASSAPHRLRRLQRPAWWGATRGSLASTEWGWDRGDPADRYYVDAFLRAQAGDISGRVLEVRDRRYTERWGAGVAVSDVLDIDPDVPGVTVVADLAEDEGLPEAAYDCFVLTQTLQFVYDVQAAVRNAHRMLAPGGVLLVTVPTVSRISMVEGTEIDHWRFTVACCERLFGEVFGPEAVRVEALGNLRSTIAFLRGLAWQELPVPALEESDPLHPLVICVRAEKR